VIASTLTLEDEVIPLAWTLEDEVALSTFGCLRGLYR